MLEELNLQLSQTAVYITVAIAAVIFATFRMANFLIPLIPAKDKSKKRASKLIPVAEFFIWLAFLIWGFNYLLAHNLIFAILAGLILLLLFIWFARYSLQDIMAGIILKSNKDINIHDIVDIQGYHGKITALRMRNLVLETEKGKSIYLPYSLIIRKEIIRSHPAEKILSHTFLLEIKQEDWATTKPDDLKAFIISLPWVSLKKDPIIKISSENKDTLNCQITVYSIGQQYFPKIEGALRETFAQ
ncbi:MAG: mechanosensitive ion channel [Bacteroidales bacterium]